MFKDTAILIFANSGSAEKANKSIRKSEILFNELNKYVLKIVKNSNIPYFLITDKEQVGNSFGERFTNAIQTVFNNDYKNVITIGNDSPQLKTKHLLATAKRLERGETVLGPSSDGGFYLMGIQKEHFNKKEFLNISWNSNKVLKEVETLIKKSKESIFKLETLIDIDKELDIKRIHSFHRKISRVLHLIILAILSESTIIFYKSLQFFENRKSQRYFNKGSPLLA